MVCVKTAEPIEMPFGGLTHVYYRNPVLDGVQIPQSEGTIFFWGGGCAAHWKAPGINAAQCMPQKINNRVNATAAAGVTLTFRP